MHPWLFLVSKRYWICYVPHQNQQKKIPYFDDRSNTVVAKEKEKERWDVVMVEMKLPKDEEIKIKKRERGVNQI